MRMFEKYLPEFFRRLNEKLEDGYRSYGDKSFDYELEQLITEMQNECLDICGWGLILWTKLYRMEQALEKYNKPTGDLYMKIELMEKDFDKAGEILDIKYQSCKQYLLDTIERRNKEKN